ncbi:hypothetical protein [Cognatishimia maritima]|uniref:Uncharacterized protein n=1 Tax=Cognatishimia maritima TaxID=870908 RepID=A0A1M5P301_9RHOB|nr:hypothetical protein [Cognatishimia maritima]SHG95543.1 hypothetical protein SAMN04488044_1686 [Cognatishimia maritima]
MFKFKKSRSLLIFKTVVLGAFGLSRVVSAAPLAMDDHISQVQTWRSVKDGMAPITQGNVPLSAHIEDMIAAANLRQNLTETIELSYSAASAIEIAALDAHWMDVLTAIGEPAAIATYMSIRASIVDMPTGESVESMVWLTAAGGNGCDGNCNNGGGNGSEGCDASDQDNSNNDGDKGNKP